MNAAVYPLFPAAHLTLWTMIDWHDHFLRWTRYLLYTDSLSLKPLPLQTLPFQFLSLHLQSLSLPEQVLTFFTLPQQTDTLPLPTFAFSNFSPPLKEKKQTFLIFIKTGNKTYTRPWILNLLNVYVRNVCMYVMCCRLPAQLYSSTDTLHTDHPFTHPLLLHLLKGQDVFPLVNKRSLFGFHHLKLRRGEWE